MIKFKTAALASALLMTSSPTFAAGSTITTEPFNIVGGMGAEKCRTLIQKLRNDKHSVILYIFETWLGGMATGVNFATPGLKEINPRTPTKTVFEMVVKQCVAEPNSMVAEAAGKIFSRVAKREGVWENETPADDDEDNHRKDWERVD